MSGAVATLSVEGRIARLFVDGPPRNEMGHEFFETLDVLSREVIPSLEVDGMIVSGRGRHFSSGADVPDLRRRLAEPGGAARAVLLRNVSSFSTLGRCRFPVVAAISGCCLGSGLELALACHARVAAQNALLAFPEVEHGLMPGCGGTIRAALVAGRSTAIDLVLSGRRLTAREAMVAHLVDAVVDRADLVEAAEAIVRSMPSGRRRVTE